MAFFASSRSSSSSASFSLLMRAAFFDSVSCMSSASRSALSLSSSSCSAWLSRESEFLASVAAVASSRVVASASCSWLMRSCMSLIWLSSLPLASSSRFSVDLSSPIWRSRSSISFSMLRRLSSGRALVNIFHQPHFLKRIHARMLAWIADAASDCECMMRYLRRAR